MTFELNATQSVVAIAATISFVVISIFFLRKNARKKGASRKILPDHHWTHYRPLSLKIGFLAALAISVVAFSFTRFAKRGQGIDYAFPDLEEIEVKDPPRTAQKKKKKPPKPIPTKIEVVPSDVSLEPVVFENPDPDEPQLQPQPAKPVLRAIAPLPRPEAPESDSVYLIVQVPPMFPGCEQISDREARKKCSDETLLNFIQSRLTYPAMAREVAIQGMVIVRFVIEKDGSVTGIELLRDPGGGLGAEAVRVVKSMPKWHPGIQGGRTVRVQFTLPVRFRLQ